MIRHLALISLAVLALGPETAGAGPRRAAGRYVEVLPPLEAGGCYYYRGRQWCGRYCYTEVNGKRYCQRWKRDAHPQAALDALLPEEVLK
jgi:hypothetical protein